MEIPNKWVGVISEGAVVVDETLFHKKEQIVLLVHVDWMRRSFDKVRERNKEFASIALTIIYIG